MTRLHRGPDQLLLQSYPSLIQRATKLPAHLVCRGLPVCAVHDDAVDQTVLVERLLEPARRLRVPPLNQLVWVKWGAYLDAIDRLNAIARGVNFNGCLMLSWVSFHAPHLATNSDKEQ